MCCFEERDDFRRSRRDWRSCFLGNGNLITDSSGSVKRIGHGAFSECRALETLTLASGVERIEDAAFGACSALKNVTIPGSVESIGENSFVQNAELF